MSGLEVRELGEDDREQAWALGRLAFGGDPATPMPPARPGLRAWGVFDGPRLVAKASLRSYRQWWGGRRVPMGGVAGVAVHPDGRGAGAAGALVRTLLAQLRADGTPVSALFPTAPGIYRALGYEVVGRLEQTLLPTAPLRRVPGGDGVRLRTAGPADLDVLGRLWQAHAAATDGQLTRDGASYPRGLQEVLEHDVVTLAERGGEALGYVAYDRGRGYGATAELEVAELVAPVPDAAGALLRSLGSWDAVAPALRWDGPVDELALALPAAVPPPVHAQPWMLRVVDAPAAVAARGYPPGVGVDAAFSLVDPDVPDHEGGWRLVVEAGEGRLERCPAPPARLHVRGLALLFAGQADTAVLHRAGLLTGDAPGLDALAGRPAHLLDYF